MRFLEHGVVERSDGLKWSERDRENGGARMRARAPPVSGTRAANERGAACSPALPLQNVCGLFWEGLPEYEAHRALPTVAHGLGGLSGMVEDGVKRRRSSDRDDRGSVLFSP